MKGPMVEEIKRYLEWKKKLDDYSAEQMMYLYRDVSEKFFNWELIFDIVDDWYDWLYIICSVYINRKNIDWFSAVFDRDVLRWSWDDLEKFAEYIAGLYDRAMEILDDCNQTK